MNTKNNDASNLTIKDVEFLLRLLKVGETLTIDGFGTFTRKKRRQGKTYGWGLGKKPIYKTRFTFLMDKGLKDTLCK